MSIHLRNRQRGFSLIEILVGAAIGLIGIVIIFQTLALTESRRRTTGAGSDTQLSGALALYTLERDLRLAGFGFSTAPELGCTVEATATARGAFNFPLLPVQIVQGAAGAPDRLNVLWGNSPLFVNVQYFTASTATTKATQSSRAGLRPGDLVIAAGQVAGATRCALLEITDNGTDTITITHTPGAGYTNAAGVATTAKFSSGAAPPVFTNGSLYNLGPTPGATPGATNPRRNVWSLSGSSLTVREDFTNIAAISVADSIIDFQAEYGVDISVAPPPNIQWTTTDPALAVWPKVRAIRVALLSRSGEYEKTAVTPIAPTWLGNTMPTGAPSNAFVMRNVDGSADTNPAGPNNWRNYRYRVHEAVIPLRNVIWGTSP